MPLHIKIEGLLYILYTNCFNEKEIFSFPKKSIFDLNSATFKSPRMSNRYIILQKQSSINVPENEESSESLQTKEDLSQIENKNKRESFNKTSKKSHYSEIKKILRQMI